MDNRYMRKKAERERKRRSLAEQNGMKEFCSGGDSFFALLGCIVFAAARLYMLSAEQSGGHGYIILLEIIAAYVLIASALVTGISARIDGMPNIVTLIGTAGLMLSCAGFFAADVFELLRERGLLGFIQTGSMLVFLIGCFIALIALSAAGLDKKVITGVGLFPSLTGLFAGTLLLVRGLTVFPALSTAVGASFSWDAAADLFEQLSWVLRSVSPSGDEATAMFYARLVERIALLAAVFLILPPFFRFKLFFEYNNHKLDMNRIFQPMKQERISRTKRIKAEEEDEEFIPRFPKAATHNFAYDEDEFDGDIDNISTVAPQEIQEDEIPSEPLSFEEYSPDEAESDLEETDEYTAEQETGTDDKKRYSELEYRRQLYEGQLASPAAKAGQPALKVSVKPVRRNTETGAALVKPSVNRPGKPDFADPGDPDFWNHYMN